MDVTFLTSCVAPIVTLRLNQKAKVTMGMQFAEIAKHSGIIRLHWNGSLLLRSRQRTPNHGNDQVQLCMAKTVDRMSICSQTKQRPNLMLLWFLYQRITKSSCL